MENIDLEYISNILANPELTQTEEFKLWIKDNEHVELYWNLRAAFDNYALDHMDLPQLPAEWETFCKRVQLDKSKKTKRKVKFKKLVNKWSIAASVLLMIFSSIYFIVKESTQQESLILVKSLSQPENIILKSDTLIIAPKSTEGKKQIVYTTISTPRGKDTTYIFNDGTEVILNAESILRFPESFDNSSRIVHLEGEAYFKVAHEKERPFIVESHGIQTKVLGTIFNVRALSESQINVTLVEGSVQVQSLKNKLSVILNPGEDASYEKEGLISVKEVDLRLHTAWAQGFFYFENTSLVEIMRELGHWYNVNIEFADIEVMQQHFNFWADRSKSIKEALNLLQEVGKAKFIYKNNTVVIYANKQT